MAVKITVRGNYARTETFLRGIQGGIRPADLNRYGEMGVKALQSATPVDTGETALSWDYRIKRDKNSTTIEWINTNVVDGVPVAVILQYGHGTRNGGYVQGRDYINPALRPIFDEIARDAWNNMRG